MLFTFLLIIDAFLSTWWKIVYIFIPKIIRDVNQGASCAEDSPKTRPAHPRASPPSAPACACVHLLMCSLEILWWKLGAKKRATNHTFKNSSKSTGQLRGSRDRLVVKGVPRASTFSVFWMQVLGGSLFGKWVPVQPHCNVYHFRIQLIKKSVGQCIRELSRFWLT